MIKVMTKATASLQRNYHNLEWTCSYVYATVEGSLCVSYSPIVSVQFKQKENNKWELNGKIKVGLDRGSPYRTYE